jgi:hypothetical protein
MTEAGDVASAAEGTAELTRPNYTGAIYGSMLAASVIVGAAAGGRGGFEMGPPRLAVLLVVTGVVFWLAHGYARLVGEHLQHTVLSAREIGAVARHEWPLLGAALPPAAVALLLGLFGTSNTAAAWAALIVAIAGQVGWATVTTFRAGASSAVVLLSALINMALGLFIVMLKAALQH